MFRRHSFRIFNVCHFPERALIFSEDYKRSLLDNFLRIQAFEPRWKLTCFAKE